jgi:O-antigen/teichoic acid export membrane protein
MKELKIFINQIGLFGISRITVIAIGILYLPLFTKLAGAEGFGIWTQILTLTALLQPFVQLGLGTSVLRFLANKNRQELSVGISTGLVPIMIIGLIFIRY